MSGRLAAGLVLVVLIATSCGEGGANRDTRDALAALDRTRDKSRTYRYEDDTLDKKQRIVVNGKIYDDLRYSGTVSMNGKKLYEAIVSDDSVAVRLLDLRATKEVIDAARRSDPTTATALSEGRWVVDHTVAPPLSGAGVTSEETTADDPTTTDRRPMQIGDDPFADGAQVLNYAARAIRITTRVGKFNPDDIQYNALDDPWAEDGERNLEDKGIRRYDLELPPLPRPAERGKRQQLPQVAHFRKMVLYVKGGRVAEIKEQISIADRREFRRAETGRAADFYLKMRDAAKQGAIQDQVRERLMSYRIQRTGDVDVKLPSSAVKGFLANVIPMLKAAFRFDYIGQRAGAPLTAGGGAPVPVVSPVATASPATSGETSPAATPAK